MKALVFEGPWEMTLTDLPDPVPEENEVLLKVEAVGICGSDVHGFTGESGRRSPGMVMGHEVCGRVAVLGAGVDSVRVDDLVTLYNLMSCGQCTFCVAGTEQLCETKKILGVNLDKWGAMAEYLRFPASGLFKIGEGIDPALSLLAEPIGVGIHAMTLMDPSADDAVAIVGSGMIGTGLAIVLKNRGVEHVFGLDIVPKKLDLLASYGAHPINIKTQDPFDIIRKVSGKEFADGTFEAVGLSETVQNAFELTAPGGTLVIIGNLAKEFSLPMQLVTWRETVIRGSYGFTRADFGAAVDLINSRKVALDKLITGTCSLEEAPEVMTRMARGQLQATKMVIRP